MKRTLHTSLLPNDTTYDAIRIIINTEDEEERDRLTEQWRSHKLEELNFIGIVVSRTHEPFLHVPLQASLSALRHRHVCSPAVGCSSCQLPDIHRRLAECSRKWPIPALDRQDMLVRRHTLCAIHRPHGRSAVDASPSTMCSSRRPEANTKLHDAFEARQRRYVSSTTTACARLADRTGVLGCERALYGRWHGHNAVGWDQRRTF